VRVNFGDRGAHATRMHQRHADRRAGGFQLVAQRFRETAYRKLGRAIGRLSGRRDDAEDAGHVDQLSCRLSCQQRQKGARQPHHGAEVDAHQPVEIGRRHLLEIATQGHAGVVDQNADAAVRSIHGGQQFGRRFRLRQVEHMATDRDAARAGLGGGDLQPRVVDVDQRQVAATCGQLQRQRGADATGRAGDHGHAAAKVQVAWAGMQFLATCGVEIDDDRSAAFKAPGGRVSHLQARCRH
jgi:hypothetical protein